MVSHTSTGEWQSFEVRMRRRRAERLVLRAEAAADAGCLDDARMCLTEARGLAPDLPGLDALDQRLSPAAPVELPATRSRAFVAAAVMAALIAALVFLGWPMVSRLDLPIESRRMPQTTVPAAVPEPVTPAPRPAPASTPDTSVSETSVPAANVPAPEVARIPPAETRVETPVTKPEKPVAPAPPPKDVPARVTDPAESLPRVSRVDSLPSAESTPGRVTVPPPPSAIAAAPPPVNVLTLPIASEPAPVVRPTPAPEPSQEPAVRSVLNRYASAYSTLDVDAAQRVWPGVNRGALSRAFEGLDSQEISLGNCRINVAAASATALCSGTASWSPKIGGGRRSEARQWTFELARGAAGWEIVTARVQNR
jgi:hypothetical protein